ncbi:hypothetical protein [Chitinophaga rhizosphaerae]|uniref:hypothetical protein n=1 Tax=Chitinophaga rhizosphaerae TaxID=1864947 RepID=UPI000F7FF38E|nr:hypothetical protein [Chitinophaga rhizosphaerae]
MESLVNGILGGEFQRHFWPGLFLNILIVIALYLNGIVPDIFSESLVTSIAIVIPVSVLTGVVMDFLGHIFVLTSLPRKEAMQHSRLAPLITELANASIPRADIREKTPAPPLDLIPELSFYLTKTIHDNPSAQKKFEEQFTYFEFNRSIALFFVPLVVYLLFRWICGWMFGESWAASGIPMILYIAVQLVVFRLAWIVFHTGNGKRLFRLGRWYFNPVFFNYDIITNIQLGMLLDYFLRNKNPEASQKPS